ncbi:hypothetical protein AVEN_35904-1 [Araneus ventricosus]|uniref:Uncharacterized protein n=1 Tax=Araneus ventricosus TaxID=182803 RepID=A0A4Y2LU22_ARAVE|nr:hypothetical protein AVEN_35904-1 [Araneus ventricosus]
MGFTFFWRRRPTLWLLRQKKPQHNQPTVIKVIESSEPPIGFSLELLFQSSFRGFNVLFVGSSHVGIRGNEDADKGCCRHLPLQHARPCDKNS